MEDTLGLVDAAVVDSHRRDGALGWRCDVAEAKHRRFDLEELRSVRAQQRAVAVEERDILDDSVGRENRISLGLVRRASIL